MTTQQQLQQARDYLATLQADRDESCSDLEEEAKVFRSSPSTDEQERRFRLIYHLVRYQVRRRKKPLFLFVLLRRYIGQRGLDCHYPRIGCSCYLVSCVHVCLCCCGPPHHQSIYITRPPRPPLCHRTNLPESTNRSTSTRTTCTPFCKRSWRPWRGCRCAKTHIMTILASGFAYIYCCHLRQLHGDCSLSPLINRRMGCQGATTLKAV